MEKVITAIDTVILLQDLQVRSNDPDWQKVFETAQTAIYKSYKFPTQTVISYVDNKVNRTNYFENRRTAYANED